MATLTRVQKAQLKVCIAANIGILNKPELSRDDVIKAVQSRLLCHARVKQHELDFRVSEDLIKSYILSQLFLQETYGLSQDMMVTLNHNYPEKRESRVPDWFVSEWEINLIEGLLSTITFEPGFMFKYYPDGVKTYFILPLDKLENGISTGIIEMPQKPVIQDLGVSS